MADQETLRVAHEGHVAMLTFNRPQVLNAFDPPLVEATVATVRALAADERTRVIVVHGEGRAFSAGFDLKSGAATAGTRSTAEWRRMLEADFDFIMAFWDCPKPTIAAVHGYCLGGAFELSLACDVTVAAASAKFGAPEVKFGRPRCGALREWARSCRSQRNRLGEPAVDEAVGAVRSVTARAFGSSTS